VKVSIAPVPIDQKERVLRAAVTAVYDRYCSSSIAELESAVVAFIGQPIPDEEDEQYSPSARSAPSFDPLLGSGGLPLEQGNEQ